MKNTNKKGFTLVELVIVIAVIAILAAVLIPTFTTVIHRANQSASLQKWKAIVDEAYVEYVADNHDIPEQVVISYTTVEGKVVLNTIEFASDKIASDYTSTYQIFTFSTTANSSIALSTVSGQEVYLNWELSSGYKVETTKLVDTLLTGTVGTKS